MEKLEKDPAASFSDHDWLLLARQNLYQKTTKTTALVLSCHINNMDVCCFFLSFLVSKDERDRRIWTSADSENV